MIRLIISCETSEIVIQYNIKTQLIKTAEIESLYVKYIENND